MIFQAFQYDEILNTLAGIVGAIVGFVQPYLTPIGQFMMFWVNYLMQFFPYGNLTLYIVIFVVLVIAGIIVNSHWTGDKIIIVGTTKDTHLFEKQPEASSVPKIEKEKVAIEKCKECGLPIGQADICPYCGATKKVDETSAKVKEEAGKVEISEELKETPKEHKKKEKKEKTKEKQKKDKREKLDESVEKTEGSEKETESSEVEKKE